VYSSLAGLTDAIAFVRKSDSKLPRLSGKFAAACSVIPATQQYSYFAPQVCSEFRLQVKLANSKTGHTKDVKFDLSSEAELLLSSLNTTAQDDVPAKAVAASYAAYALDNDQQYDFAEVEVQAEFMPRIAKALTQPRRWVTTHNFYFKR
jgi:hypothetical protein